MLQMQYYTYKLSKKQINHILNNYNIKYNTMKSEIEAKMNLMIQVFLKDIYAFLENIEEIALEREKLKDLDRTKQENKSLKNQLQEKSKNECRLKSEIDALNKKLNVLKAKLNDNNSDTIITEYTNSQKQKKNSFTHTAASSPNRFHMRNQHIKLDQMSKTISNSTTNLNKISSSYSGMYKTPKRPGVKTKQLLTHNSSKVKNAPFTYKDQTISSSEANERKSVNIIKDIPLFGFSKKDNEKIKKNKSKPPFSGGNNNNISNRIRIGASIANTAITNESENEDQIEIGNVINQFNSLINGEIDMLEREEQELLSLIPSTASS